MKPKHPAPGAKPAPPSHIDHEAVMNALTSGQVDALVIKDEVFILRQAQQNTEIERALAMLRESHDTLEAIKRGEADALVIEGRVFTLKGADQPYRDMVEQMQEGALTLSGGLILFSNRRLAEMLKVPLQELTSRRFADFVIAEDRAKFDDLCDQGYRGTSRGEIRLATADPSVLPVQLAINPMHVESVSGLCIIVTDLTQQKLFADLEQMVAERTRALRQSNLALQEESEMRQRAQREMLEAGTNEQIRLGQELHDGPQQTLTALVLKTKKLERKVAEGQEITRAEIEQLPRIVSSVMSDLRAISRNIFPVTLEKSGLVAALEELAANSETLFNIRCKVTLQGRPAPDNIDTAHNLYRIAQETIHNAVKHSRIKEMEIRVRDCAPGLELMLIDDSPGFEPSPQKSKGMGLRNMFHRVQLMRGTLKFERQPDGRFAVVCTLPAS